MALQKEELWKRYTDQNPHWLTEAVTLTPAGLKKLFDQTFDRGHSLGLADGVAATESGKKAPGNSDDVYAFFDSILGGPSR